MTNLTSSPSTIVDCELCILGTGIAGLNALYAATHYLPQNTRVVVIDKNEEVGGMWQNTYKYVRLHQPHQFFTVGDLPWKLKKAPSYLASRTEIIDHMTDCYAKIKEHFDVRELFGSQFERQEELRDRVQVYVSSNDESIQINTKQFIKAKGFNIKPNEPFKLSTKNVVSCVPENLDLDRNPDKPVYIIGGGKTAMDTALEFIRHNPKRPIHLIAGKGTWFMCRDDFFPTGINRYWKGSLLSKLNRMLARKFDGDNAEECLDYFKENGGISLQEDFQYFVLGLLSREENETIKNGLSSIITDYLLDVVESDTGAELRFKNSNPKKVEEGAIFVNCSGYLVRDMPEYEPYLSPGKRILSIQSSSSAIVFTTYASYFLTHMFFRDKLENSGLYQLNYHALDKKNKSSLAYVASTHLIYNFLIFTENLPASVVAKCHLNLDLWFPKHRQLISFFQLLLNKKHYKEHCKQSLDRFEAKYQVGCRPLSLIEGDASLLVMEGRSDLAQGVTDQITANSRS